ncbi:MAG: sugar transferase [Melioribacteraceae bacterium]|nr:sugar transferase [Melioribacteraceae bacterium]
MEKRIERLFILIADFLTINFAWLLFFYFKVESGMFNMLSQPELILPMFAVYFYWLIMFIFVGMYRTWFATSRFDEISTLFKTTFVGIFVIFFIILYDDYINSEASSNRFLIMIYWGFLFTSVSAGRLFIRSFQRHLIIKGIGRKNTVIIGFNKKAHNIHDTIGRYKALGLDVKAYVAVKETNVGKSYAEVPVVDTFKNIDKVLVEHDIKEVIIALEHHEEDVMLNVIGKCDSRKVSIKIVPDLYEVISGLAHTNHIYGFPLIEIMPQLMPEWEKKLKRIMDIFVSIIILILTLPINIVTAFAIKYESKGPIFFKQDRMGLDEKPINIYKFRSMVNDAEKKTGPIWSMKDDPRITRVGAFIRRVRIDEIPQMINVLKGEMSLVGPRPEREYFVNKLSEEIPLYRRRLTVRPGVTGWAQVKHKYDETMEDVKTKLQYDLFYIENMSLRMDIKILLKTVFVVLFGKGHYE